jgi:SET domain-containing protein
MSKNVETRMTNDERSPNAQTAKGRENHVGHSNFVIPSSLDIRHSSFRPS